MITGRILAVIISCAFVGFIVIGLLLYYKAKDRFYYVLLPAFGVALGSALAWAYGLSDPILQLLVISICSINGFTGAWVLTKFRIF